MQLFVTRLRMCPRAWATLHRLCGCTVQSHTCLAGLSQVGNYFRKLISSLVGASSAAYGVCVPRDVFSRGHLFLFIYFTFLDLFIFQHGVMFHSRIWFCNIMCSQVLELDIWTIAVWCQPKKFHFILVWAVIKKNNKWHSCQSASPFIWTICKVHVAGIAMNRMTERNDFLGIWLL